MRDQTSYVTCRTQHQKKMVVVGEGANPCPKNFKNLKTAGKAHWKKPGALWAEGPAWLWSLAPPGCWFQEGWEFRAPEVTLDSRGMRPKRVWTGLRAQLQVSDAFSKINHMQYRNLKLECYTVWLLIPLDVNPTRDPMLTASYAKKLPVTAGRGHLAYKSFEKQIWKCILKRNNE